MVKIVVPYAKKVYTITPPNPRKLDANDLAECFQKYNVDAVPCEIAHAISEAKEDADSQDVIACFGSLYSVASLINV